MCITAPTLHAVSRTVRAVSLSAHCCELSHALCAPEALCRVCLHRPNRKPYCDIESLSRHKPKQTLLRQRILCRDREFSVTTENHENLIVIRNPPSQQENYENFVAIESSLSQQNSSVVRTGAHSLCCPIATQHLPALATLYRDSISMSQHEVKGTMLRQGKPLLRPIVV